MAFSDSLDVLIFKHKIKTASFTYTNSDCSCVHSFHTTMHLVFILFMFNWLYIQRVGVGLIYSIAIFGA